MKATVLLTVFLIASFCIVAESWSFGRTLQSVGVRGVLTCEGKPAVNVTVQLFDEDRDLSADDLLDTTTTDKDGKFEVKGHETEYGTIDPKYKIFHTCKSQNEYCHRIISVVIPDRYISEGMTPKQLFEVGTIELSKEHDHEEVVTC